MTVLVTGSAGLVGHAVRRRLEGVGVEVVPVDVQRWSFDGVEQIACDLLDRAALDQVYGSTPTRRVVEETPLHPRDVAELDPPDPVAAAGWPGTLDLSAAARDLGWTPRADFADAVAAYRDWLAVHA